MPSPSNRPYHQSVKKRRVNPHLCTSNNQLNLPLECTHQNRKLLTHALQAAQAVVLRERSQEVRQDAILTRTASNACELLGDSGLVLDGESRRGEDGGELGVGLECFVEFVEGRGDGVEGGGLCACGVLYRIGLAIDSIFKGVCDVN